VKPLERGDFVSKLEDLLQLKSEAHELKAKLEQAKLDKASEYVSFAASEIETRILIAKSNRR
jgi:hypothetical protein